MAKFCSHCNPCELAILSLYVGYATPWKSAEIEHFGYFSDEKLLVRKQLFCLQSLESGRSIAREMQKAFRDGATYSPSSSNWLPTHLNDFENCVCLAGLSGHNAIPTIEVTCSRLFAQRR